MVAIVVVIVDVDDEEGEGGGEDAPRRRMHAMLCTMHVFGNHNALSLQPGQSRCAARKVLTSADAACPRPVSFLRMMHH